MPVSNRRVEEALSYLVQVQERADRGKAYSRQERIDLTNAFGSFFGLYKTYLSERHKFAYQADSRKRDQWLRDFWRREPHIAGVINSVVSIDKNRSWTLTGTKRQVVLYNNVLRMADDGEGWREFMSVAAESYYTTDMGTVVEVGRQGRFGPMRGLYNVNPTHVRLTGNRDFPLEYIPPTGKSQKWSWVDFFRVASLPNIAMNGLGFCALSRAVELVCLLMAVYEYDQERLLAKAPKGLLLLHNIGQQQWEDAMSARKENMSKLGQEYFSGVMVLAQEGMDQMDAKLIGLSQLPDGFDREVVTNQIMYGISMIFGYTPDEFWPVQYGALGRARETEIHHMRAVTKGGSDFTLGIQDRLQRELPDTVLFEFDKRDSETDILEAEVYQAWAKVAESLYGNNIPQFVE